MPNPSSPAVPNAAGMPYAPARRPGEFLGHPTCLFTLFFAELWERFSFYGMLALLILYMENYLLWNHRESSHVMAWYTGLVYCTPLLGGFLADLFLTARWAVVLGGVLMAIGHFLLAFEPLPFFYGGLTCLIIGCGFLKPNISTQVGSLYRPDDQRRDSAFTIFYMGINTGACFGPFVCDWLRLRYGFPYGFGAAGVGMVGGLIVYLLGMRAVVRRAAQIAAETRNSAAPAAETPSATTASAMPAHVYRDRVIALLIIFAMCTLFWMSFAQSSNVLNLWADKHTNLHIFRAHAPAATLTAETAPATATAGTWRDIQIGAGQLQSANPFFIITLAPVFAWFWIFLERRKKQPATPTKLVFGFFFMMLAYGAMLGAAAGESRPTSAPLAQVPPSVKLAEYGATRLNYDATTGTLRMHGVLTDLDRMRALADSSPLRPTIEALVKQVEQQAKSDQPVEQLSAALPADIAVPDQLSELPPGARWEPATRTLTVARTITAERVRLPFLAANPDPGFRVAIDTIYQQSSTLRVSVLWLILFYLLVTVGELCLSPVGLSLVTKAAPPKLVGLFMGLWFFATGGVANWTAHFIGGQWGTMTPTAYFMIFGGLSLAATLVMLLLLRVVKPLLHGIH